MKRSIVLFFLVISCFGMALAQKKKSVGSAGLEQLPASLPASTKWTLDAAGELQRVAIKSVVFLACPATGLKGTGFIIYDGLVVTNNHVVNGCTPEQMIGISVFGTRIMFTKMATDPVVDLALLRPSTELSGGLQLAETDNVPVGASVSTWGYPLQFNGPAPLLGTGFVAGYLEDGNGDRKVRHLVVDGAINPGNSGGPLFAASDDKVIGIVVAKFLPYSPAVEQIINAMSKNSSGLIYNGTDGSGKPVTYTEGQLVAKVLQEFYNGTQVMIGEAIAVSELRTLISAKEAELK